MEKVFNFLKEAGTYYLATVDEEGKPRVRPFGTVNIYEGKLYIQTGKSKDVFKQIEKNPFVEICAFNNGTWLRVNGKLINDHRFGAKKSLLDNYPELKTMYDPADDNTAVLCFEEIHGGFYSFTSEPELF